VCSPDFIRVICGIRGFLNVNVSVSIGPAAAGFVVKGEVFAFVNLRTLFFVRRWLWLTTGE
jgi:hypothetical protein